MERGIKTKISTEKQKFPIMAGGEYIPGTGKHGSLKLRKVGTRTVEFTYQNYSDGDKQLIGEREVSRSFYKRGRLC